MLKLLFHVVSTTSENKIEEINHNFAPYIAKANDNEVENETYIAQGNLIEGVQAAIHKRGSDMVIAGTHGKHGILQHLFGSKIFNLIREIPCPFLVLNTESKIAKEGFKNILVPVRTILLI